MEIVGAALESPRAAGGLIAFKYDDSLGTFLRLWYSRQNRLEYFKLNQRIHLAIVAASGNQTLVA